MSDNLGDFFAKQKAKKQKNQKGQGKDASATGGASTAPGRRRGKDANAGGSGVEETKTEQGQLSSQQAQSQQDFVESSDEETNIELDANVDAIKDTKEIEANKRKEEDKELSGKFGWAGLDKKGGKGPIGGAADDRVTKANAPVDVDAIKSRAAGGGAGMITFGRGPPKFTKAKNMINQSEFPELGDFGKKGATTSGKDSTSIGHFGSSISGSMQAEGGPSFASAAGAGMFQESKGAPKMPIFKGKAKLKTGVETTDESVPSKQNYDFSSMKMSASTSKTAAQRLKEDGEGQGEGKREFRSDREDRGERHGGDERSAPQFEDDFEEVTDKKRAAPTFSRGGRTFGQF